MMERKIHAAMCLHGNRRLILWEKASKFYEYKPPRTRKVTGSTIIMATHIL